jgi:hypothetical protein
VPGNDCVGSSAADDDQHIQTIYKMMLYGWHAHLITGELRMLIDEFGRSSKEGLLAQITEVRERLQAKPL